MGTTGFASSSHLGLMLLVLENERKELGVLLKHRCFREMQTISFLLYLPISLRGRNSRSVTGNVIGIARQVKGRHHGIGQLACKFICTLLHLFLFLQGKCQSLALL